MVIVALNWNMAKAQIYSQGKNLNNLDIFFLNVELVNKPMDPSRFHAKVDFHGRRQNVDWYLKEGVSHKSFENEEDVISYMEKNGWIYLESQNVKASNGNLVRTRYLFRKSMKKLKLEYEDTTTNEGHQNAEKIDD